MKKRITLALMVAILVFVEQRLSAQQTNVSDVSRTLSYQGVLSQEGGAMNGQVTITASLFDDQAGTHKAWEDTYTTTCQNGVFNLLLGSGPVPLPQSSDLDKPLWIGI